MTKIYIFKYKQKSNYEPKEVWKVTNDFPYYKVTIKFIVIKATIRNKRDLHHPL